MKDKTNEELLKEVKKLKQENISLRELYQKDIDELKQAEKALIESEERFQLLFNQAPLGYQSLDFDGNFIEVNQQWLDTLGYGRDEVIGKWFGDFLSPAYQDGFRNRFPIFKAQGKIHSEFEMVQKNGNELFIAFEGKIGYDLNGEFKQTHCILQDITESKKANERIQESESKYRELVENSPDAIIIYQGGRIIFANSESLRLIGAERKEDIMCKSVIEFVHPDSRAIVIERMKKLQISGTVLSPVEERFLRFDGSEIDVEVTGMSITYENRPAVQLIIRDITQRKQAELKQKEIEKKLKESLSLTVASMESIHNGILVVSNQGAVLKTNGMFAKMWNIPSDLLTTGDDKILLDFVLEQLADQGEFISKVTELYNTPDAESYDLIYFKDGRIFERVSKPMYLEDLPQGRVWSFLDITKSKKDESELVKAKEKAEESDRLKSAFLANMSHEIRTPMNGILGFTELLKEPNLSTDDQQDFIQTIQISGERMLNTINNIVDVSKIESGLINLAIDETNINKKIEFAYKFFKPEVEKKELKFLFKTGLPTKEAVINTDNEKVYGVLTNLIKNAIKFTYEGSIEFGYELKLDTEPGTERSRSERSRSTSLQFYVKDTGVGIPKNQIELIFERFRQGSYDLNRLYEGSGLGLSISKSYIEMLGGKIWVESEEGKGSTFYFTIPYNPVLTEKTEINSVDSSEIKKVQMKELKILIVEDDEVSYSLLKRTIQKIGKEVLHAINGVEAVEACRTNPDLDLILMDIRMPQMDGNEATHKIRQFNKDVIIIAQTAYAFSGDSEKAIEAGCNDYITKPINMALLFELIKKHVINK